MILRIKKKNIVDWLVILCLGFYTLIAHWIWFGRGIQETVMIVFSAFLVLKMLLNIKKNKDFLWGMFVCFMLFSVVIVGVLKPIEHEYLMEDIKYMCGAIIVAIAVFYILQRLENGEKNILDILYSVLNVYFFINNIIIVMQYFIPYFLMNKSAIGNISNNTYFDQLTGFLGINGTTRWIIVSTFLIILNFYIGYKRNQKGIIQYNIFLIIESAIISMINSARGFLIIAPLTIAIYMFYIKRIKASVRVKQIGAVLAVVAVLVVIYLTNDFVNQYVNELIADKFRIYLSGDISYMVAANDDRVKATVYAVENGGLFGNGIGSVPMHSSNDFTKHLGLNSASSYIYMIGVIGYFLVNILCAHLALINDKNKKRGKVFVYIIYLLVLSYLLPIYSSFVLLPAIFMIFYIFSLESNERVG